MSSIVIIEDGIYYVEHDFHVHRFDADVPMGLRTHAETLGRFESPGVAAVALEERKRPENLHVEHRTEWTEIECNCAADVLGGSHYDDCDITLTIFHFGLREPVPA